MLFFFFRSFYRFFYDRIRKAAALQGGHHKVAAAIGQLFHVAAAHQSGGSFQLRAFAVCVRGIDAFQRLLDLRAGKALLPQDLGRRTAALAGGKQAVCPGFGIAVIVYVIQLHHLSHSSRCSLLGKAIAQPFIQLCRGHLA